MLHGPGELAEALPYLIGFHPDDSLVMIGLHAPSGRFGVRLRVGIPSDPRDWPATAAEVAGRIVRTHTPHGRPDGIALFLCQDPAGGEHGTGVVERLRPLAQQLRTACGVLDVPVIEALCVSAGRWWSYTCPPGDCCPPEGAPVDRGGTSVIAAAAAYAGIHVRGSLRDMEARLRPMVGRRAIQQRRALDEACEDLLPRMLVDGDTEGVAEETMALAGAALERFRAAPPPTGGEAAADAHDDGLLGDHEAAAIILGLQDRDTRDQAAEWMEEDDAVPAIRLWRALARRCVGGYADHAAAPLTLAGWVSWSTGDEPTARVTFARALDADPHYTFANLLSQACHRGLDPEPLRSCLRQERGRRLDRGERRRGGATADDRPRGRPSGETSSPSSAAAGARPGGRSRARRRPGRDDSRPRTGQEQAGEEGRM